MWFGGIRRLGLVLLLAGVSRGGTPVSLRESRAEACAKRVEAHHSPNQLFNGNPLQTAGSKCRGRELLQDKLGIALGTWPPHGRALNCTVGKLCNILVFDCGGGGGGGGDGVSKNTDRLENVANGSIAAVGRTVSSPHRDLALLRLYVRVVGPVLTTAKVETIPAKRSKSVLRVSFQPVVEGNYRVEARLNFWDDTCDAIIRDRNVVYSEDAPDQGLAGMYLGGLENRCVGGKCTKAPPRSFRPDCDAAAMIIPGPKGIAARVVSDANEGPNSNPSNPRSSSSSSSGTGSKLLPRCSDGFGEDGAWFPYGGCAGFNGRGPQPATGQSSVVVDRRSNQTINAWSGSLCRLAIQEGKPINQHARWQSLYWARPGCRFHYPSPAETRSCLEEEDVAALIFVGDSVLRSLYASFLDLLGLNAHEKQIKESHKAPALTIGKFHVAFMEFWFHNDIQKVYFRWKKLFEGQMQDVLNQNNRKNPATILLVVNLGVMHQLHGACNDAGGYARTLSSFKSFLAQWYSSLPEENRPRIRGVIYGAPAVLGLRNAGVSFGRGEAITRRAVAALGGRAGSYPGNRSKAATNEEHIWDAIGRFQLLDLKQLTAARFDATLDGFHYGQSVRMMQAVGLINMVCDTAKSLDQEISESLDDAAAPQFLVGDRHGDRGGEDVEWMERETVASGPKERRRQKRQEKEEVDQDLPWDRYTKGLKAKKKKEQKKSIVRKVHNQKVYGRDLPKSALPQLSILDGSSEEGNRGDDGVDPEKPYFHRIDRPSASKAQRQQVQHLETQRQKQRIHANAADAAGNSLNHAAKKKRLRRAANVAQRQEKERGVQLRQQQRQRGTVPGPAGAAGFDFGAPTLVTGEIIGGAGPGSVYYSQRSKAQQQQQQQRQQGGVQQMPRKRKNNTPKYTKNQELAMKLDQKFTGRW